MLLLEKVLQERNDKSISTKIHIYKTLSLIESMFLLHLSIYIIWHSKTLLKKICQTQILFEKKKTVFKWVGLTQTASFQKHLSEKLFKK